MNSSKAHFEQYLQLGSAVEVLDLGDHTVLHNTCSRAIVLTRKFVSADFSGVIDELQSSEVSQLKNWKAAGLLDHQPYEPIHFVKRSTDRDAPIYRFQSPTAGIEIRLHDQTLAQQLCCILDRYHTSALICVKRTLVVEQAHDFFTVYENERPVTEQHGRDEIRFFLIRSICETLLASAGLVAILHGSAVDLNGRALIMIGTSGSGKTTTALGLMQKGAHQLSDDHVAVHADGSSVIAFPTAIGLKSGSWSLPEAADFLPSVSYDGTVRAGVRYVSANRAAEPGLRVPVTAIIFPDHQPGADLVVEPLSPEECFVTSIQTGGRIAGHFGSVAPLTQLFNTIQGYRIIYSTTDQVQSALNRILIS